MFLKQFNNGEVTVTKFVEKQAVTKEVEDCVIKLNRFPDADDLLIVLYNMVNHSIPLKTVLS